MVNYHWLLTGSRRPLQPFFQLHFAAHCRQRRRSTKRLVESNTAIAPGRHGPGRRAPFVQRLQTRDRLSTTVRDFPDDNTTPGSNQSFLEHYSKLLGQDTRRAPPPKNDIPRFHFCPLEQQNTPLSFREASFPIQDACRWLPGKISALISLG